MMIPVAKNGESRRSNAHIPAQVVSLAVSADISQAQTSPDGDGAENHARGGAVAQHLQSMLSHISSHVTPLNSGMDNPEVDQGTKRDSACGISTNTNNIGYDAQLRDGENIAQSQSSSPPPHKEFLFRRWLHAIDNYLHPPSKLLSHVHFASPRNHHQGHRFESMHSSGASNHACMANCQSCTAQLLQQHQQQNHSNIRDNQNHRDQQRSSNPARSSRRLPTFASFSNKAPHNDDDDQTSQPRQSRSFFPFSFHSASQSQSSSKRSMPPFRGPLLYNTTDHEEHEAVITTALHVCKLYQLGHDVAVTNYSSNESDAETSDASERPCNIKGTEGTMDNASSCGDNESSNVQHEFDSRARHALFSLGFEFRLDVCHNCSGENDLAESTNRKNSCGGEYKCPECITRLYHVQSDSFVTKDNRRTFIADGKMYDAIANLCQAAAQEIMAETCDLTWVTICDGKGGGLLSQYQPQSRDRSSSIEEWPRDVDGNIVVREPVRALVGRKQRDVVENDDRDTFLVATGKGKVRAGIFSRHHLITTGLEPSTALPLLRQARDRDMNCVVIDPNARGDRVGMDTFEMSMRSLFEQQSDLSKEEDDISPKEHDMSAIIPSNGSIYVLAHSAAGGQLVRYLIDQECGAPLLSRLRCIAFTDSTHSIQWLKKYPHISSLLQSSNALYVRTANPMRDDDWENASPGDECPRDHFWSHRFGDIKTVWAGTTEHSLSNWTAQKPIWDHMDKIRRESCGTAEDINTERRDQAGENEIERTINNVDTINAAKKSSSGKSVASEESPNHDIVHHIGTKPVVI